jgi:hypothetical protein
VYGCDICFQVLVNIWFNLNFPTYLTFGYNTFVHADSNLDSQAIEQRQKLR